VPIAAGVLYPVTGLLLSPMIAALAMSLSSVSVIGNALRLRTLKLERPTGTRSRKSLANEVGSLAPSAKAGEVGQALKVSFRRISFGSGPTPFHPFQSFKRSFLKQFSCSLFQNVAISFEAGLLPATPHRRCASKAFASLDDDPQVSLPNFLKFAGCSKRNGEFEMVAATATGDELPYGMGGEYRRSRPGPFDGTWKTGTQSCVATEGDGVPVLVAGAKLKMYESDCEIGKATAGKGFTKAKLVCSGEGEEWGMSLELVKKSDRLLLAYDGEKPNAYERCPRPER